MRKTIFMLEEFFRSFQKSVFKNLLLMLMFSISLVMAVIMCSYYLDLGERHSDTARVMENSTWFDLELSTDSTEIVNTFASDAGCRNMMAYYEKIRGLKTYPILSAFTQQGMTTPEEKFRKLFANRSYQRFLTEEHPQAFMGSVEDESYSLLELKCVQFDYSAFEMFGLKAETGVGFTKENTTLHNEGDPIPIVVGNEYKGTLQVGERIDLMLLDYKYPCEVVGILERGSQCPEDGDTRGGMVQLDSYILFPYGIQLSDETKKVGDLEKYAFMDFVALDNGAVQAKKEDLSELVAVYRDIGKEFSLPPIRVVGTSMGLNLLRKESATNIRILMILTIALVCFTFYGLFVTFYDKIQSNSKVYGIYLMNGCSLSMILLPCLLEIFVILLPAMLTVGYVFTYDNVGGGTNIEVILRTAYAFCMLSFLAGAGFIIHLIRGVDTERLVRKKD